MNVASDSLARLILELLEPLMDPKLFDPVRSSRCLLEPASLLPFSKIEISGEEQQQAKRLWDIMLHDLRVLIYKAASVHLSIRLTGSDGTNIRILRPIEKGTAFTQIETMDCINRGEIEALVPEPLSDDDELQVKMTCWGQVEAVVPHGVDLDQYEQIEAQQDNQNSEDDSRSFDGLEAYFREHLPILPAEIQENAHPDDLNAGPRHPGTEWDHQMAQDEAEQRQKKNENNGGKGKGRANDDTPHQPQRGSYVTYYKCVVRSQVYCAWAKQGSPQPQTLDEAVEEARLAAGIYYQLQDNWIETASATLRLYERSYLREYRSQVLWLVITLAPLPAIWKLTHSEFWLPARHAMWHLTNTLSSWENTRAALSHLKGILLPGSPGLWTGLRSEPLGTLQPPVAEALVSQSIIPKQPTVSATTLPGVSPRNFYETFREQVGGMSGLHE